MLAGLPDSVKKELGLLDVPDWAVASPSHCRASDEAQMKTTLEALSQMSLIDSAPFLWNLLAAILHLGNITFVCHQEPGMNSNRWKTKERNHLNWAARLLGLDSDELLRVLTVSDIQHVSAFTSLFNHFRVDVGTLHPSWFHSTCSSSLLYREYVFYFEIIRHKLRKIFKKSLSN